ncbi:hypothetical protein SeMB42_g04448 [Synchytrium endobioticum]|uniref:Uncharacterized protein n=1 Tax=Synchytrium endobioticum TaxID=286115 RepID=A0A507CXY8_9FUNG|nr:hypothetical protein SeMB42_g04448 [Synchytrium endobioticum]
MTTTPESAASSTALAVVDLLSSPSSSPSSSSDIPTTTSQPDPNTLPNELVLLLTASLPKFGYSLTCLEPFHDESPPRPTNVRHDSVLQLFEAVQALGRRLGYLEIPTPGFKTKRKRDRDTHLQHYDCSRTEMTSRIEAFIQSKRSKIDCSNQAEFTHAFLEETCARTCTKEINRSVQMKLAVVENADDPLAASWRTSTQKPVLNNASAIPKAQLVSERLANVEVYLDIQPHKKSHTSANTAAKPEQVVRDVLKRIKAVEDRIMLLERDYPVWSSRTLNQGGRARNANFDSVVHSNHMHDTDVLSGNASNMGNRGLAAAAAAANASTNDSVSSSNTQQAKPQQPASTPKPASFVLNGNNRIKKVGTPSNSDDDDATNGKGVGVDLDAIDKRIQALKDSLLSRKL